MKARATSWVLPWCLALAAASVLQGKLQAQTTPDYLQIGISSLAYNGDLGDAFSKWTMGFHAGLLLNQKKRFNGSFQLGIGRVTGQDLEFSSPEPGKKATTFFNTRFVTVNYEVQYNIIRTEQVKFYIGQGFGIVQYSPKDDEGNKLRDMPSTRPDGESYGSVSVILPTKLGLIYFLPNGYGLGLESGLLNTMTDFLDNVGRWGGNSGADNVLYFKFSLNLPVNL
jgi:hypothetical protein